MIVKDRKESLNAEQLVALYVQMKQNGDNLNAAKILDIYEKFKKQELVISFAGHFSAGKSSMINALLGEEILPKSPIPTSANVVKINSGDAAARVFFTTEQPVEYKEPYDIEMIKEYSKDKETIKKIEISTGKQIVPTGSALIDTPGIDAADDADRIMTEASLHLADVLFYVMDYNHVQSEVNLQFLKSIQEKKLPYFVVINQIDKHDEQELSFISFDKNIKQTFDQWSLKPNEIYYTSLKEPSIDHNEFEKIKEKIFIMMGPDRPKYLHIQQSVWQVMDEHRSFLAAKYESLINEITAGEAVQSDNSYLDDLAATEEKLLYLENEPMIFEQEFLEELQQTLNNAYLMPAHLRDKAQLFLESQQSDFKIGLFASKKKTELEKIARAEQFLAPLKENMQKSIQWKFRDKLLALLKKYAVNDTSLQSDINGLVVTYELDHLLQLMKPGAKVNGDYVLNYTNDVSANIKNSYKQLARKLLHVIQSLIVEKNEEEKGIYEQRLAHLKQQQNVNESIKQLESEWQAAYVQLEKQYNEPKAEASAWDLVKQALDRKPKPIRVEVDKRTVFMKENKKPSTKDFENNGSAKKMKLEDVVESIESTIKLIHKLPGFESLKTELMEKADRLKNRSYTIALFGAFSAGKSSFANALMGEKVLPVSPNPTTATVNRICPVNEKYPHGTVVVTLKNQAVLANDLQMITKKLSPKVSGFHELIEWVKANELDKSDQLNKMYQAYLHAMLIGYGEHRDVIGKTITINLEQFASYVTDETKACYIESINLYYDCALTREGITLVDTPGADSINARHTNVAFEYIKHADAILYVTYYNHALSRADKDFLMQLGRVKEAFQLDKMFFIVNAADLAADEAELKLVTDYVQEQLLQLGIRLPRLYPVSSKMSLEQKTVKKSLNKQMQQLEADFYQFIYHDLATLTIESAIRNIERTSHTLNNYIQSLNMDRQEKEIRINEIKTKEKRLISEINSYNFSVYKDQIAQKINKQLFYVLERLSIRFHDMFKEMYNPTTITESGKKAQNQLRKGLENLLEYIAFELLQELQAVSLRIESYIHEQLNEVHQTLADKSLKIDSLFELPDMQKMEIKTPSFEKGLTNIDLSHFNPVFSKYKGTKAFFEKNEKEFMKEQMYVIIKPCAQQYIDTNHSFMESSYQKQLESLIQTIRVHAEQNIHLQVDNYLKMLQSTAEMPNLLEKQKQLNSIIKH
ncbi:dynamin family protein [Oceanobacillus sp. FSL K6-2867]|uniref:dynamin family protein n=1 Tax=Oceanobacillus sp. FSL K6-2867 TaxID=2954748 RepID=UPI0030D7A1E2